MINQEISRIFNEIAEILELKEVQWKPRAYKRAAQSINNLPTPVTEIYKKQGLKGLDQIPGVGERLSKKIEEYIKTKKIKEYEQLKSSIPHNLDKIMNVVGIGPKRAKELYNKLKIKTTKDLEQAIKQHKIRNLFGFGEKIEQDLAENLNIYKKRVKKTYSLQKILPIADSIKNELKKLKEVKQIEVAGSIRRKQPTVGDIDIIATSKNPKKVIDKFVSLKQVKKILAKGETKAIVVLNNNIQSDLRVVPENSYGAALQYFTGDKQHNIALRIIARNKGLKLSEYGIFDVKTNKKFVTKTEEQVYKILGLKLIPPMERHNRGELERYKITK
ncbi:MAG: hypothetical protein ISS82_00805 [Nanoarchaeota archaeon]|nr:hypothetical protein [Nanoarchaeota archaeon]